MEFEKLKEKLSHISEAKLKMSQDLGKLKERHKNLTEELRKMCVEEYGKHDMVRDWDEHDFHTHYICTRCGEFR